MTDEFDAYHRWLGIRPEEQPPNHYRLLGIALFESDPNVIEEAADRQMRHVQSHKMGQHSSQSQTLLNELATAKLCLLNVEKRRAYDATLAPQPSAGQPPTAADPQLAQAANVAAPAVDEDSFVGFATAVRNRDRKPRPAPPSRRLHLLIAEIACGAALMISIAYGVLKWREGNAALADSSPAVDSRPGNAPQITPIAKHPGKSGDKPADTAILVEDSTDEPADEADSASPLDSQPADDATDEQPREAEIPDRPSTDGPSPAGAIEAAIVQPADADPAAGPPDRNTAGARIPPDRLLAQLPRKKTPAAPKLSPTRVAPAEQVFKLDGHPGPVLGVAISPDGRRGYSVGTDEFVWSWDLEKGSQISRMDGHGGRVQAVAASADGHFVVTAATDRAVYWWERDKPVHVRALTDLPVALAMIAVAADGETLVTAGQDSNVFFWRANEKIPQWDVGVSPVNCVAVSRDGRLFAAAVGGAPQGNRPAAGADHKIHLFDRQTGRISDVPADSDCVWSLAFSPDGLQLAAGCQDQNIRVWNVGNPQPAGVLRGHAGIVRSLAYASDGQNLVSAADDGSVRVWDVKGREVYRAQGHKGPIRGVSVSADGRAILSGGDDRTVRLWRLPDPNSRATSDLVAPRKSLGEPVPELAERAKALDLIKVVFQDELTKAKKPAEKLALAEKMLSQAGGSQNVAERYVLLTKACDLARDAGSPRAVVRAIDELSAQFAVDPCQLAVEALEPLVAGGSKASASVRKELAESVLPLADRAVAQDAYGSVDRLLALALSAAAKAGSGDQAKHIKARQTEVAAAKKHFEAAQAATETLATHPDDSAANLVLGKYLCFTKNEWSAGLPRLAKVGGSKLADLAQQDVAAPRSADDQVALADGWYDIGATAGEREKRALWAHARQCYGQAEPQLSGLSKSKVAKRLEEIDKLLAGDKPESAAPADAPAANIVAAKALFQRIHVSVKKGTFKRSPLAGPNEGQPFSEIPTAGVILGGFKYTADARGRIRSLQPIYLSPKGTSLGSVYGNPTGAESTLLARKGYAVGGLKVSVGIQVEAIKLVCMKVEKNGLNARDQYATDWIGLYRELGGNNISAIGGDGQPAIGICGSADDGLTALGLIQLEAP